MSRKSENSRAGSVGDGESVVSSYETSPRKSPEYGTTGPFGDYATSKTKTSSELLHKMEDTNSSSDIDDQECYDLRMEYLQRLTCIREKLASIDIANKSYYDNCFGVSAYAQNQCTIRELSDDEIKKDNTYDTNNTLIIGRTILSTNDLVKEVDYASAENELNGYRENTYYDKQNETLDCSRCLKSKSSMNLIQISKEGSPVKSAVGFNYSIAQPDPDNQIKTILNYKSCFDNESTSIELLDLNYNPPKKRYCVREHTPKMALSDSAIPLSDKVRLSLRDDNQSSRKRELEAEKHHPTIKAAGNLTKQHFHIFPEVDIECATEIKGHASSENLALDGREDAEVFRNRKRFFSVNTQVLGDHNLKIRDVVARWPGSANDLTILNNSRVRARIENNDFPESVLLEKHVGDSDKSKKTADNDNLSMLFIEAGNYVKPMYPKSNRTIVAESTQTFKRPPRTSNNKSILIRSARNKVKPVDNITLWEELRTMEALNSIKRLDSSSTEENNFLNVLFDGAENQPEMNIKSVCSLELPPKATLLSKFPSITKITRICSSIFVRKPKSNEGETVSTGETISVSQNRPRENQNKIYNDDESLTLRPAYTLLNFSKEQDVILEVGRYTPSDEEHSEYSYRDEEERDIDEYYHPYCMFCFCFSH